jgi:Fe-S-cluster containining protein
MSGLHKELEAAYDKLPSTICKRKAACCSLMPEMTLLEALNALQTVLDMPQDMRLILYKRIIKYFMINPVKVIKCPFLEKEACLIYKNRFLGCRAYGLWSKEYYEKLSNQSRQTKMHVRSVWEYMNIHLPKETIEFQVPYCTYVVPIGTKAIHDDIIHTVAETVENLSRQRAQWHHLFRQTYFSDLSFLLTSLVFGVQEAVSLKFKVVSDIVKKENTSSLYDILDKIPDIFQV